MSKNTKPNQTQASTSNQKVKELKLSDITTLTDEKIFQARLKKMIKKAQKDEAYLKYLKDKPIEAMNEAELQPVQGLKLKIITERDWEGCSDKNVFTEQEEKNLVLIVPTSSSKELGLDKLNHVAGGYHDQYDNREGDGFLVSVVVGVIRMIERRNVMTGEKLE